MASLTKMQSATPWSDLQAEFAGTGVARADAPAPKKTVAPLLPPAPILKKEIFGLSWTEVSKAKEYVLEESGDAEFKSPGKVVYQGSMTSWMDLSADLLGKLGKPSLLRALPGLARYYRVKAIGKGAAGASDWSNVVSGPL